MKPYTYTNSRGTEYYLHRQIVAMRGGKSTAPVYYFRKDINDRAWYELPDGYTVVENPRNGYLTVQKKANKGAN